MVMEKPGTLAWEISVPIFRNSIILTELGIALGIPFGLLVSILLVVTGGNLSSDGILYPLMSIGILFLFGFLFIIVLYGGHYAAGYIIDEHGILNYTQRKQAKKNFLVNGLLVLIGLFSGRPSSAGAGLLAHSRQSVFVKWGGIRKVKIYPESRTIVVKGGFADKVALFCTADNFQQVRDIITSKFNVNEE